MNRLTKAALATGVAAFLLLGGAGTVAYWSGQATATGMELASGNLTVTNGTCTAWAYTTADGGGPATKIVPGDEAQTVCTVQVQGVGDHLAITATFDATNPAFTEDNALAEAVALTETNIKIDDQPVPVTNFNISDGLSHTLTVTVTAEFDYGDADTTSINDTQDQTVTLSNVVIDIVQTNPMSA